MDLATVDYVRSLVTELSPAEIAALPGMIRAASGLIERWCKRPLGLRTGIDELYPAGDDPILRSYPVARVRSVSGRPTVALSITNVDPAVTTASAEVPSDDPEGLVGSTLVLRVTRLGVETEATIAFTSLPLQTVAALAAAVTGMGGGWTARAYADTSPWGPDEILAGQGEQAAMGIDARFLIYSTACRWRIDRESGLMTILDDGTGPGFDARRFGPTAGVWEDTPDIGVEDQGLRVRYDAGYDPIPDLIQLATAELVKATFERMATSSVLQSERTASWSWTARQFGEIIGGMPDSVRQVIASYKDTAR